MDQKKKDVLTPIFTLVTLCVGQVSIIISPRLPMKPCLQGILTFFGDLVSVSSYSLHRYVWFYVS